MNKNQIWHFKNIKKIEKQLKQNGEWQAFQKDLQAEKNGQKLFDIKNKF